MSGQEIIFPAPEFKGGMPFNEVVAGRRSERQFDPSAAIDPEVLGQLLWAATGVNRPDAPQGRFGKTDRSNPTARNWQEIKVFVFAKDAVYEYDAAKHALIQRVAGDHRALMAGTEAFNQDFVLDAPTVILFVADLSDLADDDGTRAAAFVDAGIACENLNLACSAAGIATVPRITMDKEGVARLLGLSPEQIPVINNPIGKSLPTADDEQLVKGAKKYPGAAINQADDCETSHRLEKQATEMLNNNPRNDND